MLFQRWWGIGEAFWRIGGLDAVEAHNRLRYPAKIAQSLEVCRSEGFPRIGGSDCHNRVQTAMACTEFEHPVGTLAAVLLEISAGRCRGRGRKSEN